jgi:hypothetical protein
MGKAEYRDAYPLRTRVTASMIFCLPLDWLAQASCFFAAVEVQPRNCCSVSIDRSNYILPLWKLSRVISAVKLDLCGDIYYYGYYPLLDYLQASS